MIKLKLALICILTGLITVSGVYAIGLSGETKEDEIQTEVAEEKKEEVVVATEPVKEEKQEKKEETIAKEETKEPEKEVKEDIKTEEALPKVEFTLSATTLESVNGEEKVVTVKADQDVEITAWTSKGTCSIWNEPGYLFIYPSTDATIEVKGKASGHQDTIQTINVKYVKSDEKKSDSGNYTVTDLNQKMEIISNVNIRKEPDRNSTKLGMFTKGQSVEVVGYVSNGFYKVKYGSQEVYIDAEHVKELAGTTTVSSETASVNETPISKWIKIKSTVNIRKGPDRSSTKLGTMYTGQSYEATAVTSNGFHKVKWGGTEVYIDSEHVEDISQETSSTPVQTESDNGGEQPTTQQPSEQQSSGDYSETPVSKWVKINLGVNVRQAADRGSQKLGFIFAGDTVEVTAITSNGFHKIKWNGKEVYIDSEHVGADSEKPSTPEVNTNTPVDTGDLSFYFRGAMSGLQDAFFNTANAYGVDPYLVTAIACHETGYGTSDACNSLNNFGGILTPDYSAYRSYETPQAGIDHLCLLLSWYRDQGRTTIESIGQWYCNGEQLWVQRVTTIYNAMKA
ncbi:MAG: SH3 domain-containing protein [Erysipelotrichaceae bacterium]|nr:SH3 domain-containing protein [Erysipelotrichaceae bacterium]